MSGHQQTLLTVSEGGIPPPAEHILNLVGAADQAEPSTATARDARISSVPISESLAIPPARPSHIQNPEDWPDVRGVPEYRPVDRHLDYSIRPMGANNIEWTFLQFMFSGVRVVGLANRAWRNTVGKVTDEVFKYKVGGQW
ncbi:hypothetical protein NliqN6_0054 [Naganishia liquefaciens]|uniref:Uncharacterized protein n=1 Tax=Naganishia liquefaciens TaxID=104408 RepID=A0A8H3YCV7_9TREE|nr:hypothetical protein NliqN6_0054 [Naganishia liquefaciens]